MKTIQINLITQDIFKKASEMVKENFIGIMVKFMTENGKTIRNRVVECGKALITFLMQDSGTQMQFKVLEY